MPFLLVESGHAALGAFTDQIWLVAVCKWVTVGPVEAQEPAIPAPSPLTLPLFCPALSLRSPAGSPAHGRQPGLRTLGTIKLGRHTSDMGKDEVLGNRSGDRK